MTYEFPTDDSVLAVPQRIAGTPGKCRRQVAMVVFYTEPSVGGGALPGLASDGQQKTY